MQCPGCEYTVVGFRTGFPSRTHCCAACAWEPGTHGPRCARHVSPYAERPRACPTCRRYAVTGVAESHCCVMCSYRPGEHGPYCHRRRPHWSLLEEHSRAVRYRLLRHSAPTATHGKSAASRGQMWSLHGRLVIRSGTIPTRILGRKLYLIPVRAQTCRNLCWNPELILVRAVPDKREHS